MNELVEKLSGAKHPIEAARSAKDLDSFNKCIDRGYVHIRFVETGTELGIQLDKSRCDLQSKKIARLRGASNLNRQNVEIDAEINLLTLAGSGGIAVMKKRHEPSGDALNECRKTLISFNSLKNSDAVIDERFLSKFNELSVYVEQFLCVEHRDLGRSGAVCPYTHHAVRKNHLYVAVIDRNQSYLNEIKALFKTYRELFLNHEPTREPDHVFKSYILMLPQLSDPLIEQLHKELKPDFVSHGLMLGQFYPTCESKGIHNQEFRPLKSTMGFMVIRYMVKNDYLFLADFKELYFERFKGDADPRAISYFKVMDAK